MVYALEGHWVLVSKQTHFYFWKTSDTQHETGRQGLTAAQYSRDANYRATV